MGGRMNSARRGARQRRRERGAILVEFAIIIPVLMGLICATVDLGYGWRASITVANSARSGARVGSSQGIATGADYAILTAVATSLGSVPVTEIDAIVVFKSASVTGGLPLTCPLSATNRTNRGVAGVCNIYQQADVVNVLANPATAQATYFSGLCTGTRIDKKWCPATRNNVQIGGSGVDHVGVYVKINHGTSTKLFGSTIAIDDSAVMLIEPGAGNP